MFQNTKKERKTVHENLIFGYTDATVSIEGGSSHGEVVYYDYIMR